MSGKSGREKDKKIKKMCKDIDKKDKKIYKRKVIKKATLDTIFEDDKILEFSFRTPPKKKTILQMIYDRESKEFFGRNAIDWSKLGLFYLIFYMVLAAICAISMNVLLMTINDVYPKWQLEESIIGTNPGLAFRPISNNPEQGSLIWYNPNKKEEVQVWINFLEEFFKPYRVKDEILKNNKTRKQCGFDVEHQPKADEVCTVVLDQFGECTLEKNYSYPVAAPCVFIKLNRIYGWIPEYYDGVNIPFPNDMPTDLIDHINSLNQSEKNQVWISCKGENSSDREGLINNIEYFPKSRGLPSYYYPYVNAPGYLSPLVAVRFIRPIKQRIINIECRAWAKNIHYKGGHKDRQGSVLFEIMLD